ncbi:MAG: hypothetical protein WCY70_01275 [Methanoculleus sp.]
MLAADALSPGEGIRFIVSPVDRMIVFSTPHRTLVLIVLLLAALAAAPAVSAAVFYPGSEIVLAGSSTGSDTVFLFVTGPNLPPSGGRLESPHMPVRSGDTGSFTMATVGAGDRWTYRWRTGETGLDPGTYTVYVVDAPVGRSDLSGHSYMTVAVTLGRPPETPVPGTVAPLTVVPAEPVTPAMPTATPRATPSRTVPVSALVACSAVFLAASVFLRW